MTQLVLSLPNAQLGNVTYTCIVDPNIAARKCGWIAHILTHRPKECNEPIEIEVPVKPLASLNVTLSGLVAKALFKYLHKGKYADKTAMDQLVNYLTGNIYKVDELKNLGFDYDLDFTQVKIALAVNSVFPNDSLKVLCFNTLLDHSAEEIESVLQDETNRTPESDEILDIAKKIRSYNLRISLMDFNPPKIVLNGPFEAPNLLQRIAVLFNSVEAKFSYLKMTTSQLERLKPTLMLPRLTKIELGGNLLDDTSSEIFRTFLTATPELQELGLWGNQLGPKTFQVISETIPNSKLKVVHLNGNKPGLEGIEHIAKALAKNPLLQSITLRITEMTTDGFKLISDAMKYNTRLRWLDLGNNKIDDTAHPYLSPLFTASLNQLDLYDNKMGEECGKEFLKFCEKLRICHVNISRNQIPTDIQQKLREIVKNQRYVQI